MALLQKEVIRNETAAAEKPPKVKKARGRLKWVKWLVVLAVLAAGAYLASRFLLPKKNAGPAQAQYMESPVQRRTITSALTGSGTLQPANSYTVTTLVQGDILSDTFEEGDLVEEGQVLYVIDSSDASTNIEKSQISLDQSRRNYEKAVEKQYVTAPVSGRVFSLNVSVGDEVTQNQVVATVRDSSTLLLKVPFPADDAQSFYEGQAAAVTLDGSFETLAGTVKSVSGSDIVGTGNTITRTVTIAVENPGGLSPSTAATASVGGIGCSASGAFEYRSERNVTAGTSGTVTAIHIPEGSAVSKGQTILTLGGDSLSDSIQNASDSLRNAQLSMENTQEQLESYTVTAPVTGTVVDKSKKAGETVSSAGGNQTLCTIYDLTYLEMTIDIDELDISKVAVGQSVAISTDAVEGRSYRGVVTKVSVVGTTSMGITSYPATIRIDETDGLLPGMNVDAQIVLSQAADVLTVPASAVSRGSRVLVTQDSPSAANAIGDDNAADAPEGYVYVRVETGDSDDSYVEITSGLTEGDTVAYLAAAGGDAGDFGMMGMGMVPGGIGGGMPGGMSGGGPNMGGGNRGGGGGGFPGGGR